MLANGRAGVNVDAGGRVGNLRNDARHQRQVEPVERVCQTVVNQRQNAGVAQQHFIDIARRGVALVGGLDITVEQHPNGRQLRGERGDAAARFGGHIGRLGAVAGRAEFQTHFFDQCIERLVHSVPDVEVLTGALQLHRTQPQRKQRAAQQLDGAADAVHRRKLAVPATLFALLALPPLLARTAQPAHDLAQIPATGHFRRYVHHAYPISKKSTDLGAKARIIGPRPVFSAAPGIPLTAACPHNARHHTITGGADS